MKRMHCALHGCPRASFHWDSAKLQKTSKFLGLPSLGFGVHLSHKLFESRNVSLDPGTASFHLGPSSDCYTA